MKKSRALLVIALLTVVPLMSMAATNKNVTLSESVQVGNRVLKPGDYRLEWKGSGPTVQVNFRDGNKTVATLPATIEKQQNAYDSAVELQATGKSAKTLKAIDFKNMSLIFSQAKTSQPGL